MSLTAKQALPTAYEKLNGLRECARHIGLLTARPSHAELQRRLDQHGKALALAALWVVMDETQSALSRAAGAIILDIFWPAWRDEVSPAVLGIVVERNDHAVRIWRAVVLERDGGQCAECGSDDDLHAHHVVRWADAPWLRLVVDNGVALCRTCHVVEHQRAA